MSFKDFSTSQGTSSKEKTVEKPAATSTADQKSTASGKETPSTDVAKP